MEGESPLEGIHMLDPADEREPGEEEERFEIRREALLQAAVEVDRVRQADRDTPFAEAMDEAVEEHRDRSPLVHRPLAAGAAGAMREDVLGPLQERAHEGDVQPLRGHPRVLERPSQLSSSEVAGGFS